MTSLIAMLILKHLDRSIGCHGALALSHVRWDKEHLVFASAMMICVTNTMVSEAEIIISATETAFPVSEKTVGGAPAVVFQQQPTIRSFEKMAHMPPPSKISFKDIVAETGVMTLADATNYALRLFTLFTP